MFYHFVSNSDFDSRMFSTGLLPLDQRLGSDFSDDRGLPSGSIVLLHYPANSELGSLFAIKILHNYLKTVEGAMAYYLHSTKPRHLLENQFRAYNWDFSPYINNSQFNFVDMWEITATHAASSSKIGEIDIRRKTYLKHTYKRILENKSDKSTIFTVVDNLLWMKEEDLDKKAEKVMELFKDLFNTIIKIGGVHFFLLPKETLVGIAERLIMDAATGIIDFQIEKRGNTMMNTFHISKMNGILFRPEILELTLSLDGGFNIESTGKV